MVSGFITSVLGQIIQDKFVVLAKVRHLQRMNNPHVQFWIITTKEGIVVSAHCAGCMAGIRECCSHIACSFLSEGQDKIEWKTGMHSGELYRAFTLCNKTSRVCKSEGH